MTGQDIINALNNCDNNCQECVANYKGKSCKEHQKKIDEWARKRSLEFQEVLRGKR